MSSGKQPRHVTRNLHVHARGTGLLRDGKESLRPRIGALVQGMSITWNGAALRSILADQSRGGRLRFLPVTGPPGDLGEEPPRLLDGSEDHRAATEEPRGHGAL